MDSDKVIIKKEEKFERKHVMYESIPTFYTQIYPDFLFLF